jgi:hypothetical protein
MNPRRALTATAIVALGLSAGRTAATESPVTDVVFSSRSAMSWQPVSGAVVYNAYITGLVGDPLPFHGSCLETAIPESQTEFVVSVPPEAVRMFQVTAVSADGEGSMGTTSSGQPRVPATPCVCTLPADVGPCDGAFPRWYYDYLVGGCAEFLWGGCEGNQNNFGTAASCGAFCP